MNPFRSIIATLLALLIASPLCCCAAEATGAESRPSCCESGMDGKGRPEKEPHACVCSSKQPRDEVKTFGTSHDIAMFLLPIVDDLALDCPAPPERRPMASTPHTGCDPPRLMLARFSRWLI